MEKIVVISTNSKVFILDFENGQIKFYESFGNGYNVTCGSISNDFSKIITGTDKNFLVLWKIKY